jgi:hypothetical protein
VSRSQAAVTLADVPITKSVRAAGCGATGNPWTETVNQTWARCNRRTDDKADDRGGTTKTRGEDREG